MGRIVKKSKAVQLSPTRILLEESRLRGAHNVLVTSGGQILINDTCNQGVAVYDHQGRPQGRFLLKRLWPVKKIHLCFGLRGLRI